MEWRGTGVLLVISEYDSDKTYAELVKLVKYHNYPPPSSIVAWKDFHSRVRKPDESFSEYLTDLRKLSEHCDFGDTLTEPDATQSFSLWLQRRSLTM